MIYKIRPLVSDLSEKARETVMLAARELQKYLMLVSTADFSIIPTKEYDKSEENVVYIGVSLSDKLSSVESKELDDAILIDVKDFTGVITGTNARAVLIAVYRYLKELGFTFLRPGVGGESYPESLNLKTVFVGEKASYRHRGICIEGIVSQKNLVDIIDWIPKASMNGYFMQFQLPRAFFDRWYAEETPHREKVNLSDDDIRAIVALGEEEIEKRSLLYHGVGHGWTTQAFGIDGSSWCTHDEPEPQYRDILAEINGERKLFKSVPLNTNLCYSNPIARERVTDNIVNYCKTHPELSYLHFWLADGMNNNCECENCRTKRTSDYYVQMLNDLDEKLTRENLDTRIVFLVYLDLLWRPLSEKLKKSDRFVLMFAPISRTYVESFDLSEKTETQPYELNKLKFPTTESENIAYLKEWQENIKCDSFDFDYHLMWAHYYDFAQYNHARVICEDIKKLSDMGLNGYVSCQVHRNFFPSSLDMNVMAETLWDKTVDFDAVAERILSEEFGDDYMKVKDYLSTLSELVSVKALRGKEEVVSEKNVKALTLAIQKIDAFKEECGIGLASSHKSAWQKLQFHAELYRAMLELYLSAAKGEEIGDIDGVKEIALKHEMQFKDEFDAYQFHTTFRDIIGRLKNAKKNK